MAKATKKGLFHRDIVGNCGVLYHTISATTFLKTNKPPIIQGGL